MSDDICILVVDDFSIMRGIIRRMILKELGLSNVIEAEDGIQAWEIINKQPVDLVICDWNMPNMTGLALLEKIRAHKDFAGLPFVMVTAESKKENIIEATKRGVTSYIVKPFTGKDLRKKLKSLLHLLKMSEKKASSD